MKCRTCGAKLAYLHAALIWGAVVGFATGVALAGVTHAALDRAVPTVSRTALDVCEEKLMRFAATEAVANEVDRVRGMK